MGLALRVTGALLAIALVFVAFVCWAAWTTDLSHLPQGADIRLG